MLFLTTELKEKLLKIGFDIFSKKQQDVSKQLLLL